MRATQIIDYWDFLEMRNADRFEADVIYRINNVNDTQTYAISTDGIGFYFYATLQELKLEH